MEAPPKPSQSAKTIEYLDYWITGRIPVQKRESVMLRKEIIGICIVLTLGLAAVVWLSLTEKKSTTGGHDAHHGHSHSSLSHDHDHSDNRGPHGGKILSEGEFELEIVIYEKGETPHFRVYPSFNHKPLDPKEVTVSVELERLGGKIDTFQFIPSTDFLYSEQEIEEPHSFFFQYFGSMEGRKAGLGILSI